MVRIRITKNYCLDELVDPFTYFNDIDNGLARLDMKAVNCLQLLRDLKGSSIRVNNWWKLFEKYREEKTIEEIIELIEDDSEGSEGNTVSKFSGFRPSHCKVGGKASAHRKGEAFDPKGNDLYKIVFHNAEKFYKMGLRRLENPKITKGWLHFDTFEGNHKKGFIRVVNLTSFAYDIKAA
jgi:hypothetical protein